jgi:ABC-2 type transport system permease protein
MPRPIDATQTFKKQAGGKMQLWFFLCSLGMAVMLGLGFLARWAFNSNLALLGVLLLEFVTGLIAYGISTQSAVEQALKDRERILDALSRGPSPIGLGAS